MIGISTFFSGAELIVKGCHSDPEIAGTLMNIQSPGEKRKFLGRSMIRFVTLPGNRTTP